MLGYGHTSHYSEYVLSSTLSIYSTLIAIVLMDYDAATKGSNETLLSHMSI